MKFLPTYPPLTRFAGSLTPVFFWAMIGMTLVFAAVEMVLYRQVSALLREGHSVEIVTAAFLGLAAVAWELRATNEEESSRNWHIPVILTLMFMRELDFDKRFTTEGILQLRLYSGPSPLFEKLIGAAVIVLILICAARLLLINVPRWLLGLRQGMPTSWLVALAGILLVTSKSLDGIGRKLAAFGVTLDPETVSISANVEEAFELIMAISLVMATAYFTRAAHPEQKII